jgi:hypothetical protein
MIGKHNLSNADMRPTALGTAMQASVYGAVIPNIYGRTRGTLNLIWNENLRKSDVGKKDTKKGEQPRYTENVDFLLASNPIITPLQVWANQRDKYLLGFWNETITVSDRSTQVLTWTDETFYALIGVTLLVKYDVSFNDYGGTPASLSGSAEIPLWNLATAGPGFDAGYRNWPYCYYWKPMSGTEILVPGLECGAFTGLTPTSDKVFKVYYARMLSAAEIADLNPDSSTTTPKLDTLAKIGAYLPPISYLYLTPEPTLGSGPEYNDYEASRKLYPPYYGLGSAEFDLGSTAMIPGMRMEVLGSYPMYWTGDADFVDIIEDILKSGITQAAYGASPSYHVLQRGLGCYEYPCPVQKIVRSDSVDAGSTPMQNVQFDLQNTENTFLIAAASAISGWTSSPSISDDCANSWTSLIADARTQRRKFWYAKSVGKTSENLNIVHLNIDGADGDVQVLEIAGVDDVDGTPYVAQSDGTEKASPLTASIIVDSDADKPVFILSWMFFGDPGNASQMSPRPPLKNLISPLKTPYQRADYWVVRNPGTYVFTYDYTEGDAIPDTQEWTWVILVLKATGTVKYGKPQGDIIDYDSLELVRAQCRANGLYGSLDMDSQNKASDWIEDLLNGMNAVAVWSGFKLKIIPRGENSAVGNGAVYVAPTAGGPVADLGPNELIQDDDGLCITVARNAQIDVHNVLQIQHPLRAGKLASDGKTMLIEAYDDVTVSSSERTSITQHGLRRESPKNIRCIQDATISKKILNTELRRRINIRNIYKFKLPANWKLLEPMDLVLITDPTQGIDHVPVRLTAVDEDEENLISCEAEPYVYGAHATETPSEIPTTNPYLPNTGAIPAAVNPPIFVEPIARLAESDQPELWIAVSDSDSKYGGCAVLLSTDGGANYEMISTIFGNAITGVVDADWPAATDPDAANDLLVDLTESLGTLVSYSESDRDNFVYPMYVEGGLEIP